MEEIIISGADGNTMTCGEPISVRVHAHLGEMRPNEILAQLVIGPAYANGNFRQKPEVLRLRPRQMEDGMEFSVTFIPTHNGHYRYGIRLLPCIRAWAPPWTQAWCSGDNQRMSLQLQGHARSKSALCAQKNRALRGRQEERTPHGIRSSCLPPARPRLCDSCVADADTPFRYALDHCALALEIDEPRRHVIPFRIQRMSAQM